MPNFSFSSTSGGAPLAAPVDFGSLSNAGGTSSKSLYINHDANVTLKNVGLYVQPYTGQDYVGLYGTSQDYLDFLTWGATASKGLIANLDSVSGGAGFDRQFTAALGASISSAISIVKEIFTPGTTLVDGDFPNGAEGKVDFSLEIPPSESNTGVRMVSLFMKYDQ